MVTNRNVCLQEQKSHEISLDEELKTLRITSNNKAMVTTFDDGTVKLEEKHENVIVSGLLTGLYYYQIKNLLSLMGMKAPSKKLFAQYVQKLADVVESRVQWSLNNERKKLNNQSEKIVTMDSTYSNRRNAMHATGTMCDNMSKKVISVTHLNRFGKSANYIGRTAASAECTAASRNAQTLKKEGIIPDTLICDKDAPAAEAVLDIFPDCTVCFCKNHLMSNAYTRIEKSIINAKCLVSEVNL